MRRAIDFCCGIGGWSWALDQCGYDIVGAYDTDEHKRLVYNRLGLGTAIHLDVFQPALVPVADLWVCSLSLPKMEKFISANPPPRAALLESVGDFSQIQSQIGGEIFTLGRRSYLLIGAHRVETERSFVEPFPVEVLADMPPFERGAALSNSIAAHDAVRILESIAF